MSLRFEPVSALADPQPSRAPARRLEKRPGRAGLWSVLLPLFIPHVWIGVGMIGGALWQLVFPLVEHPVVGHVVDKVESTSSKTHTTTYSLVAAFTVDGIDGTHRVNVDQLTYARAQGGDAVPLRAARIGWHASAIGAHESMFPVLLPVALFWNGVIGVFVWVLAGRPILRFWLLKRGVRARGTITRVERTTGKGAAVTAHYSYDGTASSMSVTPGEAVGVPLIVGSEVEVFHHPRWPSVSVLEPLCAWRVADDASMRDRGEERAPRASLI